MPTYTPPLRDMRFVLHDLLQSQDVIARTHPNSEFGVDVIDQVLEESGKFAREVMFPLNQSGDLEGCSHDAQTGDVRTPAGFKDAYAQFCAAGWPSLGCDAAWGGQAFPQVVTNAVFEMWLTSNSALAMYVISTYGAYELLAEHGTAKQKEIYLPRLSSGDWIGTMCLTEPHAGTDIGMIRTRAVPIEGRPDEYAITGGKIFITSGEHDLTDNIVHLVLARLPDAPPGTKGISLFLVPKLIPEADGSNGRRNSVRCGAIEHKMGIHGSSTCQMNFDGATGYLVGQPNRGLNAMFVMMNAARLGVGMQGLGVAEIAYQNALAYAKDRQQSRSMTGVKSPGTPADPIIVHPDVRRSLLAQKAYVEGGRALAYWIALMLDQSSHPDQAVREQSASLVSLLTPVVKAFLTDNGFDGANMALQLHGGHGYIVETGMEQFVRDARIFQIYEGTNSIQSLDLLGRKVLADGGKALGKFDALIREFLKSQSDRPEMAEFVTPVERLLDEIKALTMEVGMKSMQNADELGAASVDYLRMVGHLAFAYLWARMASLCLNRNDGDRDFYDAKLHTARFYFAKLLPEVHSCASRIRNGAATLMAMPAHLF